MLARLCPGLGAAARRVELERARDFVEGPWVADVTRPEQRPLLLAALCAA